MPRAMNIWWKEPNKPVSSIGANEIKKGGIMLEDIPHANPITNLLKQSKEMLRLPIRVKELKMTNRSVSFMSLFSP